jgi:hypothetical protein
MKFNFLKIGLFLFIFKCALIPLSAQEIANDKLNNQTKRHHLFQIYVDINGGFTSHSNCPPNSIFGCFPTFYTLANVSVGYRIDTINAIGLSKTNFQKDDVIAGLLGLEYRITPTKRLIFGVEIGMIDKVIEHLDHAQFEQHEYLPNQSERYYFRLSAGLRFWRVFSLNLNYAQSGKNVFDYSKVYYDNGKYNSVYVRTVSRRDQLLMWTLGLNFPIYSK